MKRKVTILRTEFQSITIEVEGETLKECEDKALEMAPNCEFSSGDAEYEIGGSVPV